MFSITVQWKGEATALEVDPGDTVEVLLVQIFSVTGLDPAAMRITGHAALARAAAGSAQETLEAIGVAAGVVLTIEEAAAAAASAPTPTSHAAVSTAPIVPAASRPAATPPSSGERTLGRRRGGLGRRGGFVIIIIIIFFTFLFFKYGVALIPRSILTGSHPPHLSCYSMINEQPSAAAESWSPPSGAALVSAMATAARARDRGERAMLSRLRGNTSTVKFYEDPQIQAVALSLIPGL
jgi:hypothetical protein